MPRLIRHAIISCLHTSRLFPAIIFDDSPYTPRVTFISHGGFLGPIHSGPPVILDLVEGSLHGTAARCLHCVAPSVCGVPGPGSPEGLWEGTGEERLHSRRTSADDADVDFHQTEVALLEIA